MQRREFLKVGGSLGVGSLALESCGRPEEKLIPLLVSDEPFDPAFESWVATLCQQCPAGCGVKVRTMQGESIREVEGQKKRLRTLQAKKIEGNALHPLNQGKTCARGQAGLQALYNPDRIQHPLRLKGPRGSGQYVSINWEEAIGLLTSRLKFLQETGCTGSLFLLGESMARGSMRTLLENFAQAFSTPHLIACELFDYEPLRQSFLQCTGQRDLPVYDLANCNLLLSLGANILETYLSPVQYSLQYGNMRQGRPGLRGKFVHAEPRMSLTAANADEWLPIRPRTEGVLALSLASVLVKESLYDKEFVSVSTSGFDDWANRLADYLPEKVITTVDLPAETITRLARELANRRPSLVIGDSRETEALVAVHCLNALLGNYGRKGGIYQNPTIPELVQPRIRPRNATTPDGPLPWHPIRELAHLIGEVHPKDSGTLLVFETNPLFASTQHRILQEVFNEVPFVASFSSFMDETSQMADLILPNHTYLERWDDNVPEPGAVCPVRTLAQPVVMPRFDTRQSGDVLLDTAHKLSGHVAEALHWSDYASLVQEAFQPLHHLQRGSSVARSFEKFWEGVKTQGGWWDPETALTFSFQTPARKFQFASVTSPGGLPEIPAEKDPFPFYLQLYPSTALWDGRGANQPWLQEMPDPMTSVMWGAWVEINPATARKLNIRDGNLLRILSPSGSLQLPAFLYPGLRPDVIAIPLGQGHQSYGRYASTRGANPLDLLSVEPIPNRPEAHSGIRVNIEVIGESYALAKFGGAGSDRSLNPAKR